jgi:hypothetical protein
MLQAPNPDTIPLPGETLASAQTSNDEEIARLQRELDEMKEREADEKRRGHVRPWDKDKPKFSESAWVKTQRDDRDPEFAPPSSYFKR